MQGRLKSITLKSSQEAWRLDLPKIPAPAPPSADGHPEPPQHRVKISAAQISSRTANEPQKNKKHGPITLDPVDENDDDFMPATKHRPCACASSSRTRTNICRTLGASTTGKLPSVRCSPSFFIKFIEHLNMRQRSEISKLGFGGLLQFYADGLDSSGGSNGAAGGARGPPTAQCSIKPPLSSPFRFGKRKKREGRGGGGGRGEEEQTGSALGWCGRC